MKFVAIADTHCRHHNLKLPKGDVILHAGDITYRGEKEEVIDFLNWFSKLDYQHKIFIAGNHDFFFEQKGAKEIAALIPDGVTYLNDSGVELNGIQIWGSPVTPWFFNWAFNRKGSAVKKHWEMIPDTTTILITHGPVYGINDVVVNGQHAGCRYLLERVKAIKPRVHLCGHIHEGYGEWQQHKTKYINASVLNESYELVNKPIVFDI